MSQNGSVANHDSDSVGLEWAVMLIDWLTASVDMQWRSFSVNGLPPFFKFNAIREDPFFKFNATCEDPFFRFNATCEDPFFKFNVTCEDLG